MNSNYGKWNAKSGSMNNSELDIGLGSGRSRSLNEQKNQTSSYSSSSHTRPHSTASWTHQGNNNKSSWTHQPVGSLSGPRSLVGDISGKSWGSLPPANAANVSCGVGLVNKDPNLFGDLLNSAFGNKGGSNVPLKSSASSLNKNSFSMGGVAESLPKTSSTIKSGGIWGSNQNFGSSSSSGYNTNVGSGNVNACGANITSSGLGGPPMSSKVGGSGGMGAKDPFSTLVDFGSKPTPGVSSGSHVDDAFGDFQNGSKSPLPFSSNTFPSSNTASAPSSANTSHMKVDDYGFSNTQSTTFAQPTTGGMDFDSLFQSSTTSFEESPGESQPFSGGNDWGFESEFGGNDSGGTTELEGLPPPPSGLSASTAKSKGMDNYKQGQYADAIKWLSWAFILLQNASDIAGTEEVLSCRASCYKEVGEYKKAVVDCTKVLERDGTNVSVLVQRALLYESMEKYKLGAEDLRTVMKLDPGNRLARSTIHRLAKMAAAD
ncbi:hypothetical protein DM860_008171 [Cuscuta australis]|uniref:Uncharacterized protein n=1 Tax=Cuscuta australis TaxID=267555 RepID=A0A328D6T9_9ASTE|nr:hypothetical protein DM860_008171 [Cuscuta australis]